jgi:hypothetical protein
MKFLILVATALLSLAIEIERRRTTVKKPQQLTRRRSQIRLRRFRRTTLYHLLVRILAVVVPTLAVAQAIVFFWGPFWPTYPEIELGLPLSDDPFTFPFEFKNNSLLFSINHLDVECAEWSILMSSNVQFEGFALKAASNITIPAHSSKILACEFISKATLSPSRTVVYAEIGFDISYASRVPPFGRYGYLSETYTWDARVFPHRWVKGAPMNRP